MRLERPRPEINVTPLVDVVLVLLIICMVITPQIEGPAVDLAPATHPDAEEKSKMSSMTLTLTATGELHLGSDAVSDATLRQRLGEARARNPRLRLVLKADRATPFGRVRGVYAACRETGFAGIALRVGDAPLPGGT